MEILSMAAQDARKLQRQVNEEQEKRRDHQTVSKSEEEKGMLGLPGNSYSFLVVLCSTLMQNDPMLRRSCTSLLYEGEVFSAYVTLTIWQLLSMPVSFPLRVSQGIYQLSSSLFVLEMYQGAKFLF